MEFGGVAGRDEEYTGISDWPSGLCASKRNHRHTCGDARDGAAAARGDRGAHKEQHIGGTEAIDHLLIVKHTFHRYFHGQILKAFTKRSFAEFGVTPKNGKAQLTEFLGGVANGGENDLRLTGTRISTSDDEDTNRGNGGEVGGTAEVLL